jgi:hypothetical protein
MEFHSSHHAALTLAGTVPLPSPYPACGPVSVVIALDDKEFEFFVKIVQVVSDKRIITRFVRPEDVRAIRGHPEGKGGGSPESWPVLGVKKIKAALEKRTRELVAKAEKTGVLDEASWYDSAIVYVAESAPVLHRDEVGVTAAVSCEDVGFSAVGSVCCHTAFPQTASHCCHVADPVQASGRRPGKDRGF